MKVVGYARVSTERQKEEATIETQISQIEQFCVQKGYELARIYRDEGVSGTILLEDRPYGKELVNAAQRREFQAVVIYKTDRLGRTTRVTENAAHLLRKQHGIEIIGIAETIDLDSSMGRTMFSFSAAIAAAERDNTLQRSRDATLRYAQQGVWLGGIVPYGYRVQGKKKEARLVLSTEKIPGFDISEVDVVRNIYQWSADEGCSCLVIAERLQSLGIPTSYARDDLETHNKRKRKTANLWRDGRVRNLIVQTSYKGLHQWGKRQKLAYPHQEVRPLVERKVPAIVDEDLWQRAQNTLSKNRLISSRSSKRQYLLRAKMKCELCGLTYAGSVSKGAKVAPEDISNLSPNSEVKNGFLLRSYYGCTGQSNYRGLYGKEGRRCPSAMVNAQVVEAAVWADIEVFLRNPGRVLGEIKAQTLSQINGVGQIKKDLLLVADRIGRASEQRERMLTLYRTGVIEQDELASQIEAVRNNRSALERQKAHLEEQLAKVANQQHQFETIQHLLLRYSLSLNEGLTFEVKRQIVEALVDIIRVETVMEGKKKRPVVKVFYRFEKPTEWFDLQNLTETGGDVRADSCSAP